MNRPLAAVVMAAGMGTRMKSSVPKHLHPLLGRRLVDWVIDAARALEPDRVVTVVSPDHAAAYDGIDVAVQEQPRGTGDAVAASRAALDGFDGDVLVLSGDTPLLTREVLDGLLAAHRAAGAGVTVLSFEPPDARPYGRVVRNGEGELQAVVEEVDASPEQRAIRELNTSIYVFKTAALWDALGKLDDRNAQGELYLTDTIAHIVAAGRGGAVYRSPDPHAPEGVNTRADLARCAAILRNRINERHMLAGVTIVDPQTTWIDATVELEPDAVIEPFTILRGATAVAAGAEVGPHAVAIDSRIGPDALVGPFCYLRPGTVLERGAKAGTFVELKKTRVGAGTKVPHLSYIGDAELGDNSNIGAGGITGNFPHQPGREKGRTTIGDNVRTGVHNAFVAPVEIGDDAWIAAGSVITEDVPPGSLAGFPPRQETKENYVYERHGKRDD